MEFLNVRQHLVLFIYVYNSVTKTFASFYTKKISYVRSRGSLDSFTVVLYDVVDVLQPVFLSEWANECSLTK